MTQQPPKIIVLGGINMDLVTFSPRFPKPGETVVGTRFITYAGGKGANQAVAAARMDARAAMVGRKKIRASRSSGLMSRRRTASPKFLAPTTPAARRKPKR